MARTYKYVVLTAIPEPRRGERINVGIAVFRDDRIDVRFRQAAYKLRAITGQNWDSRVESAQARLESLFAGNKEPAVVLSEFEMVEPLLKPSKPGFLNLNTEEEYEERVEQIIRSLVALSAKERVEAKSRINTEIAKEFSRVNVLARGDESIDDHKIVRNFVIDESEGLQADFALKNGKLHVASTLDLRKQNAGLGESALKSIVLDKAVKKHGKDQVVTIGVYAVDPDMRESFKSHIDLLGDYAQELYDWQDPDGRLRFQHALYDAMGREAGTLI
jgi:hypothetical protein